ncbi:olfactory receptor 6X1-like [Neopelma chrysocephalum]|uniref:olfactory receptor 6X1-like n=1 Tax=Neopelma chrysocephalum TaxID=114329 RepID=UPI000FCD2EDF|nr:olfactory receptor 6X1-like [Neopelma chrysocephalum]
MENQTSVTEFILLSFPSLQRVHVLLFVGVLLIYLLNVIGNVIIIAIAVNDNTLHKPMYFFLGNLSFLEIVYVSTTIPKFLASLLKVKKSISIPECKAQAFFYFFLSVDGWLCVFVQSVLMFRLPFCGPNTINHFYCDVRPLLELACTETNTLNVFTSFLTIASYFGIIFTILRIPSASGRQKAFSTCIAHLIVVIILYGTVVFLHVSPGGQVSLNINKVVSILNTVVTPLLNPFIYTLRNKEVKTALKKFVMRNKIFQVKE